MRQQEPAQHYYKKAKEFHKEYLIFTKMGGVFVNIVFLLIFAHK